MNLLHCVVLLFYLSIANGQFLFYTINSQVVYGFPTNIPNPTYDTITVPIYNVTTPRIMAIATQEGSTKLYMMDAGQVTYQSIVIYDLSTGTFTIGGFFNETFSVSTTLIEGFHVTSAGVAFALLRGCSGSVCTMYWYRLDNFDVNGAVIDAVLLVQIGGITAPGYRGLSFRTYDQLFYTTYLGIVYQMSTTSLALGSQFSPPLPYASFTIPISFQFNRVPQVAVGGDLVYWYTATSTTFKQIYSYNTSTATVSFNNVLYPQGIDPILTAWYGSSVFHYTTGFITQTFTSGEMTTGITTGAVTTGSVTTSIPITSASPTTGRAITTSPITSGIITSGKITSGISLTTGKITTSSPTTGRLTTASVPTTRAPTTGITTSSITTGIITTTGPQVISKFTSYVAVSVALLTAFFIMITVIGIIMIPAAANYVGLYDLPSETF